MCHCVTKKIKNGENKKKKRRIKNDNQNKNKKTENNKPTICFGTVYIINLKWQLRTQMQHSNHTTTTTTAAAIRHLLTHLQ